MKRNYFLLSLLIFTLMFSSCSKDDDPEPTTAKITVSTTVIDYGTIANVTITLYDANTDNAIATKMSDTSGKAIFENVTPRSYIVEAEFTDIDDFYYFGETNIFSVSAGDNKSVSITLLED